MNMLTVIVCTMNSAASLERCFESIRKVADLVLRVIVVDGESVDKTLEIIASYESAFNISVVSKRPMGVYDAMNAGLLQLEAHERYIYFLHGDDEFQEVGIRALMAEVAVRDSGCHIYYGNVLYRGRRGLEVKSAEVAFSDRGICTLSHPACVYSKEVFDRLSGFTTTSRISGDAEMFYRAKAASVNFTKLTDEAVCRFYSGGLSSASTVRDQVALFMIEKRYISPGSAAMRLVKHLYLMYRNRAAGLVHRLLAQ